MRIQAISDPLQLGVPIVATTCAKGNPRHREQVADHLATRPQIRYLGTVLAHAYLAVESVHAITAKPYFFIEVNLGLEGIISSATMQVTNIKKSVWDWEVRHPHATRDDESPALREWEEGT